MDDGVIHRLWKSHSGLCIVPRISKGQQSQLGLGAHTGVAARSEGTAEQTLSDLGLMPEQMEPLIQASMNSNE